MKKEKLTARKADINKLYEESVQCPEFEVSFIKKLFKIIQSSPRKFLTKEQITKDKYRAISDFISGMTEMMNNGMAGMLQNIAEGGTSLSEGAKSFIASNNPGAEFSFIPNIWSGLFILSVLVIQLGSIWMPKQD